MSDVNENASVEMKNTIPLWLAVGITVMISLPFGILLGKFNIALWASFIVWAQYFNYGATARKAGRIIFPCTFLGAFWGFLGMVLSTAIIGGIPALASLNGSGLVIGTALGLGFGVMLMVFILGKSKLLGEGSLSYFNGMSLFLAMYFTGSGPIAGLENPYAVMFIAYLWTLASGYFGFILAWFNVLILFPKEVK